MSVRYFVVTGGGRYGPADVATLRQWAADGRIGPSSVIKEEVSGRQVPTASVFGAELLQFQQPPASGNVVAPSSDSTGGQSMTPPPPGIVSNYRRPNYEPPLFLANEVDGRRELRYSFIFAVAGPLIAIVHIYGIGMVIGGIYCGALALKRGRKLGALGIALNIVAVIAAVLAFAVVRFRL
jgi:hypothetical protein